jgi:hypothetical protein
VQTIDRKTHSTVFDPRRLCYAWHPWYDLPVLTRPVGAGAAAYLCKLADAEPDAMLVEIPQWMFDPGECSAMHLAEAASVDCIALRALQSLLRERNVSPPVRTGDTTAAIPEHR